MTPYEIIEEIQKIQDEQDLRLVYEGLNAHWKGLHHQQNVQARFQIKVGDRVSFVSRRLGGQVFGTVTKKARTRAGVKLDGDTGRPWLVPFGMLTKEV